LARWGRRPSPAGAGGTERSVAMAIDPDELEDFRHELGRRGLSESEFTLAYQEDPLPRGLEANPVRAAVRVERKVTGVARNYNAGHCSHWVVDFIQDLDRRIFE
jgi:hypothetical protein